ncbi:MAG: NAD-dependent epimerase/dehydratase family protein [Bdellovibrionota bacterium]
MSEISKRDLQPKDHIKPEILVTGVANKIGSSFVTDLAKTDKTILGLYLNEEPVNIESLIAVRSDYQNLPLLIAQMANINTVIHLEWDEEGRSLENQQGPSINNLVVIDNLIKAAEQSAVKRIIYLSVVGVDKNAKLASMQERYQAEVKLLNSRISEKIIVRVPIVYGSENTNEPLFRTLLSLMKFPFLFPVLEKGVSIPIVHIDDVVKTLLNLVNIPMADGCGIVEVKEYQEICFEELCKLTWNKFRRGKKIPITGVFARMLFFLLSRKRKDCYLYLKENLLNSENFVDTAILINNPLSSVLPNQLHSLRSELKAPL